MGKDPAFLFYPNDYIGGTMGMTFEEKGAYIEILMLQFNRGHMTSDMISQTVGQIWVKIQNKFKVDSNGLFYNERLDIEIEKRKSFILSRFNNLSGKNKYSKKEYHKEGHMTKHMENEDINETANISEYSNSIKFKNPTIEEIRTYCLERKNNVSPEVFYDFYEAKGWMIGKNVMKNWKAAVRTWEDNNYKLQNGTHPGQITSTGNFKPEWSKDGDD